MPDGQTISVAPDGTATLTSAQGTVLGIKKLVVPQGSSGLGPLAGPSDDQVRAAFTQSPYQKAPTEVVAVFSDATTVTGAPVVGKKAFGTRPGFMAVSGYDGIHLIYEALKKTGGKTDGDALIEAMKGMKWESPRGPISIDPETRDIVQNIYIRKVEKVDGELYNVEFQTFDAVKDSGKTKK